MALFEKKTVVINKKTLAQIESEERIEEVRAEASKSGDRIIAEQMIKKDTAIDRKERPWMFDDLFSTLYGTKDIAYPNDPENIAKTVDRVISLVKSNLTSYLHNELSFKIGDVLKFTVYKWIFKLPQVVQAFAGEPKVCNEVRPAIEKAKEGIKKIKSIDPNYNTSFVDSELNEIIQLLTDVKVKNKSSYKTKTVLASVFWIALIIYCSTLGLK